MVIPWKQMNIFCGLYITSNKLAQKIFAVAEKLKGIFVQLEVGLNLPFINDFYLDW